MHDILIALVAAAPFILRAWAKVRSAEAEVIRARRCDPMNPNFHPPILPPRFWGGRRQRPARDLQAAE